MKSPDLSPALATVVLMMRTRADAMSLPEDLLRLAESAGLGDAGADRVLGLLLRATAAGNRGVAAGRAWPADEDVLIAMSIRDGIRAAVAGDAAEAQSPTRVHTIIVNGQAVEVPRGEHDHVPGVAQRAVEMAGYPVDRSWEVKDADGRRLGCRDDPDRIRHISLPAGTAS